MNDEKPSQWNYIKYKRLFENKTKEIGNLS